ncbi:MAG: hypothetical protein AABX73_01910 [Nanoarchaeota archaeon]
MKKRMNKKAQDLSIGTLILIVLGIVVLVLLILGFSLGWGNLWEKINIFQGGSNIESVISACNIAVASNSKYTYCQDFKKIKVDGKTEYVNCEDSRVVSSLNNQITCDKIGDNLQEPKAWYCEQIKSKLGTTTVKVNGNDCPPKP